MGIFDFIKSAGKALGIGGDDEAPTADALKKELENRVEKGLLDLLGVKPAPSGN